MAVEDTNSVVDQMLDNHEAESIAEVRDESTHARSVPSNVYDDETCDPLTRLQSYIDYCFERYDFISDYLDRDDVQCCTANWDNKRGYARSNWKMEKQKFNKRVTWKARGSLTDGHNVLILGRHLIGTPPEKDNGVGWKACARHELGHLIDWQIRGVIDHSAKFTELMERFGHENNDGQCAHGYGNGYHRRRKQ